jgi:hypothetical protein
MNDLEPWSAAERRILEQAGTHAPPPGAEDRVFANVLASIGAVALVPAATAPSSAAAGAKVAAPPQPRRRLPLSKSWPRSWERHSSRA